MHRGQTRLLALLALGGCTFAVEPDEGQAHCGERQNENDRICPEGYECHEDMFREDSCFRTSYETDGWSWCLHAGATEKTWTVPGAMEPAWARRSGVDSYGEWAELVVKDTAIRLRHVLPGQFVMGLAGAEDTSQRAVTITRGFWLSETEVSEQFWYEVMGLEPMYDRVYDQPLGASLRSWEVVQCFVDRLSQLIGSARCRLPTEAEWEYACMAGQSEPNCVPVEPGARAGSSPFPFPLQPIPVAENPNAWGFFDMEGNAGEWCSDWLGFYGAEPVTDPTGPTTGEAKVLRLGKARYSRGAFKDGLGYRILIEDGQ